MLTANGNDQLGEDVLAQVAQWKNEGLNLEGESGSTPITDE